MSCEQCFYIFKFITFGIAILFLNACFSKDPETVEQQSVTTTETVTTTESVVIDPKDQKPLNITRMSPIGEDISVPRQIVFQFNRAVVPIGRMEREQDEIPVTISPELKCQWRWINTSALACQLDDATKPSFSTQYRIIMEPGIKAEDGAMIEAPFEAEFLTLRPRVTQSRFKTWRGPGHPVIRLRLNQPVAKSTIEKYISFEPVKTNTVDQIDRWSVIAQPDEDYREIPQIMPAPGEAYGLDFGVGGKQKGNDELRWIDGEEARSIWLIQPKTSLPLDSNVNVKVVPGLASVFGSEMGIENRVIVNFDTFPEFKFLGVKCATNKNQSITFTEINDETIGKCNPLRRVSLAFSSPVLGSEIKLNTELAPPLDGGREDYDPWENYRDYSRLHRPHKKNNDYEIYLPENLQAAQKYDLKIFAGVLDKTTIAGLKDEFGRTLDEAVTLSFFTDHRPENFEILHEIAVLEQSVDSDVPLYATNLDKVKLDYRALTASGQETNKSIDRPGTGGVKDIQFSTPLGVREMLKDQSGAVYGFVESTPKVDKHINSRKFFAIVSPYQIQVKMGHYNSLVWVVDMATGNPVPDADVKIYVDRVSRLSHEIEPLDFGKTDESGLVRLKGTKELDPALDLFKWCGGANQDNCDRLFIRIDKGDEMGLIPLDNRLEVNTFRVSNYSVWSSSKKEYGHIESWGTTAQGVYRAGGEIDYKIYVRDQDNETFVPAPKTGYHLELIDPTGKTVHEIKDITLSEFGGFDGSYKIPETAPVGWYQFKLKADFAKEFVWEPMRVLVSDFTPSPFKASNSLSGDLFHPGDVIEVESQSKLHSGGPYSDAEIRVTATYFPSGFSSDHPQATGFNFNRYNRASRRPKQIFQNIDKVDANGAASLSIDVKKQNHVSGNIRVESAIRDDRGKYVATTSRAAFMGVDRLVGMKLTKWTFEQDKAAEVEYIVVDERGKPVSGTDVDIKVEYLEVKSSRVKGAGNAYITNFVRNYIEVGTCNGKSKKTSLSCIFTPEKPGSYRLTASIKDTKGRNHISEVSTWVIGKGRVMWEQVEDNSLQIVPEETSYNIGDTARYLVKNPYPGAKALISIERYGVLKSWVQSFDSSTPLVEFEVTKDFMPGFYLSVTVMSPRVEAPLPEVGEVDLGKPTFKTGYIEVPVIDPVKRIDVEVSTNADVYKPRETVKLDLKAIPKVKDKDEPIELAVVVLDESVLDLINDGTSYFDPYEGFYALEGLDVRNFSLLTRLVGRQKFEKKGANAGGDGGADFDIRSLFKYVSYWNPSILADENGAASVEFTVPDNLTGWRVLAFAMTPSDRMGLGQANFKVNRPTELRPVMPNQITETDIFKAGFSVMNRTDKTRRIKVELTATGDLKAGRNCENLGDNLGVSCSLSKTVKLKPYKRSTVYMPIEASSVAAERDSAAGTIQFDVIAQDKIDGDGLSHDLIVNKRRALDVAANYATSTSEDGEEPILFPENIQTDVGHVSVVLSPSVIGNVEGAFTYIRDYDYSGWEPKLTQAVMASHFQNLKSYMSEDFKWDGSEDLTQALLEQATNYQAPNGGMVYYRAQDQYVSPYLSAYTALAFNWLAEDGYDIPEEVEAKLHDYLASLLKRDVFPTFYSRGMSSSVRAVALAALSKHEKVSLSDLERYRGEIGYMDLFGRTHFMQAALNVDAAKDIRQEVTESILATSFQSGGKFSFNEELDDGYRRILATPMRANCSILSAMTRYGQMAEGKDIVGDIPFKLTRTITQTRGNRDHWENTQENIFCMNALVDYSKVYESTDPDLNIVVELDGDSFGETEFKSLKDNTVTVSRAISEDDPGKRRVVNVKRQGDGQLYYATRLHYAPLDDHANRQNAGIDIRKELSVERGGKWELLKTGSQIKRGELVRVDIYLSLPTARNFVVVDDPVPGGLEPVNRDLATSSVVDQEKGEFKAAGGSWWFKFSDWSYYNVSRYSFYHKELRHDAARFYSDYLPAGNYNLSYTAQAIAEGEFSQGPVHTEEVYDPDIFGKGLPGTLVVDGSVGN